MSKEIEIFISSRFFEFKELREKIKKERFSKLDVGLKLNMLDDKDGIADVRSPAIASIEEASGSDIFILLLGESYKEVLDDEKSYTHQEYDSAVEKGLNILAFPIGDCYDPAKLNLSKHHLFSKFQKETLQNNKHITAPYTPSAYDVDKMYEKIYQSLKAYIQKLINEGMIEKSNRSIDSKFLKWSSIVVASTVIGFFGISYVNQQKNNVHQAITQDKLDTILQTLTIQGDKPKFLQAYFGDDWEIALQNPQTYHNLKLKLSNNTKTTQELLEERDSLLKKINAQRLKGSLQKMIDKAFQELRYEDVRTLLDEFIVNNQSIGDDLIKAHFQKALTYIEEIEYHKAKAEFEEFIPMGIKDAEILHEYGSLYWKLGEYDKMLECNTKTLALNIEEFGENHSSIATNYNQIGLAWYSKGEYDKAIEFYNKSLKIYLATLGENHPLTATSYNNIALTWNRKGEYDKAIEFLNKDLKITIATLGENHPSTATSYNNIGQAWYSKGEYDKAIEFYNKSLKIYLATLGENHPSTATTYNNIGLAWDSKGDYDKAIEFYKKDLKITLATLGENHPSTATTYNNIAMLYYKMEKYQDAYDSMEKAVKIDEMKLPSTHPYVIQDKNNLETIRKSLSAKH